MKISLSVLVLVGCVAAKPFHRRHIKCFNADGTPVKDTYVNDVIQANVGISKPTIVPHKGDGNPASLIAAVAASPTPTPKPVAKPIPPGTTPAKSGGFGKWPLENGCDSAHRGDGTVFDFAPGQFLACGVDGKSESENWFAVSHLYPEWGNQKSICGKEFFVTYKGKTIKGKLYDKCGGCKKGDIDLSRKMWNQLTDEAYPDRFQMQWYPA